MELLKLILEFAKDIYKLKNNRRSWLVKFFIRAGVFILSPKFIEIIFESFLANELNWKINNYSNTGWILLGLGLIVELINRIEEFIDRKRKDALERLRIENYKNSELLKKSQKINIDKVKHYVYLSDTKVNMIYEQLENNPNTNRYEKLSYVLNYLEKENKITTLSDLLYQCRSTYDRKSLKTLYFKGTLSMRWGEMIRPEMVVDERGDVCVCPYCTGGKVIENSHEERTGLVFFGTKINVRDDTEELLICFGGAVNHVIGKEKTPTVNGATSQTGDLIYAFSKEIDKEHLSILSNKCINLIDKHEHSDDKKDWHRKNLYSGLKKIYDRYNKDVDFTENLEFVAKFVSFGGSPGNSMYLLATPIYVAYADD